MKYIFGGLAVGVVTLAIYLSIHLGYFKSVSFQMTEMGPYQLIYKDHIGPYYKIVPDIEEVEKWVKSQGIDCHLSFGQYLDNPSLVEEARLHSRGGCIVDKVPEKLPEGFQSMTLDKRAYIVGHFQGSPSIGPYTVYPKAQQLMQERHLASDAYVMEIYEIKSPTEMQTTYLFPYLEPKASSEGTH